MSIRIKMEHDDWSTRFAGKLIICYSLQNEENTKWANFKKQRMNYIISPRMTKLMQANLHEKAII